MKIASSVKAVVVFAMIGAVIGAFSSRCLAELYGTEPSSVPFSHGMGALRDWGSKADTRVASSSGNEIGIANMITLGAAADRYRHVADIVEAELGEFVVTITAIAVERAPGCMANQENEWAPLSHATIEGSSARIRLLDAWQGKVALLFAAAI